MPAEEELYLVYVSDFAGRPMPQIWRQRNYAVDAKAEDACILQRTAIAPEHDGYPIAAYVEAFPYVAPAEAAS